MTKLQFIIHDVNKLPSILLNAQLIPAYCWQEFVEIISAATTTRATRSPDLSIGDLIHQTFHISLIKEIDWVENGRSRWPWYSPTPANTPLLFLKRTVVTLRTSRDLPFKLPKRKNDASARVLSHKKDVCFYPSLSSLKRSIRTFLTFCRSTK